MVILGNRTPVCFSSCEFTEELVTHRNGRSQTATAAGLTAGAVGAPPARLTLAAVGGHTAPVDTALGAVGWTGTSRGDGSSTQRDRREEKDVQVSQNQTCGAD